MSKFLKSLTDEQLELLKSEVTSEFERRFMATDSIKEAQQFNAQARRDEIVEKAKQDIKELAKDGKRFFTPGDIGNYTYKYRLFYVEFVVNRKKRTVVALVRGARTGKLRERGIAKCHPNDCFNVHIGKVIALRRALGLDVPDEYLNTPQPTVVRVGDIVKSKVNHNPRYRVINEYNGLIDVEELEHGIPYKKFTIETFYTIDDSREGVAE